MGVIRFHRKGGLAANRRRSFASLVPACHFDIHAAIMAYRGTDIKPTVVFLARFSLEGLDRRLSLKGNGLQRKKSQKTGKTRKKAQNSFSGTHVFLPSLCELRRTSLRNGPVYRPKTVLLILRHHGFQGRFLSCALTPFLATARFGLRRGRRGV